MGENREVELKLELEPGASAALTRYGLLSAGPAKTADQLSVYFDTAEGDLRSAGFSLRIRETGGRFVQTVKQAATGSAGLFDRPEWEWDVRDARPNFEAVAETPLGSVIGKKLRKRLRPLIRVEVRRSTWNLQYGRSRIELILDEGNVRGGDKAETIAEVELELKEGEKSDLVALARELGSFAPLRIGVLSKAERGYVLADGTAGKAVKAEPIRLQPEMSTAEGFAAIAYACLRHFRRNEALVVQQQDSAALHQARVAMRRLRSAFTLFRGVNTDGRFPELREEVRWFANQLGDARNLDVLLKRFGNERGNEAETLQRRLRGEREKAYAKVLEALASDRLRRLMIDLLAWIEAGAWRAQNDLAALPLPQYASSQLDRRWRKVRNGGRMLAQLEPEPRHQLRIEIKKLRYAVEFLSSLTTGDRALQRQKAFVSALEEMQERLGELNDVETARELLGTLLAELQDVQSLQFAQRQLGDAGPESRQLKAAEQAFVKLTDIGRFWR